MGGSAQSAPAWPVDNGSSAPITLPKTMGSGFQAAENLPGMGQAIPQVQKRAAADGLSLHNLYGGAAAAAGEYNDDGLANPFSMYAVRANSPVPYVAAENIKVMGVIAPGEQKLLFGAVTCLVTNDRVTLGGSKSELNPKVQWCMRTGPKLTVWIDTVSGDVEHNPAGVAAMVDETWGQIVGSAK